MSLPLKAALGQCARHAEVMQRAMRQMPLLLTAELVQQQTPELTHEYPEDPHRQLLALTAARVAARQLVEWLEKIQARSSE